MLHIIICSVMIVPALAQDSLETSTVPSVHLSHIEINNQFIDFSQLADSQYHRKFNFGKTLAQSFDSIVPHYNYPINLELPYSLNTLTFHFVAIDW